MARCLRSRWRAESGFSLVELLVVMLLTGVVGAALLATVAASSRAERQALDMRDNTDHARVAVERVRDVVRAAYGVCNGSDATTVRMWAGDENENNRIDPEELVTFAFVSGELRRTRGTAAPSTVAFGLGPASAFTYQDRAGADVMPVATGDGLDCASTLVVDGRGEIGTIGVTLAGDDAPEGRTPGTVVSSQLTLRNAATPDGTINPNRPPVAGFVPRCSGRACTFDASTSYDSDGTISGYVWEFGDGASMVGKTVAHTYLTYGTYQVILKVTDNGGATAEAVRFLEITAGNAAPSAGFTVGCAGLLCQFDASYPKSFDSDGTIQSYAWDFGYLVDDVPATGTGVSTYFQYPEGGAFDVRLTVTDNLGLTGVATATANPSVGTDTVKVVLIEDISTLKGASGAWIPKVRIRLAFGDGTEAHGVIVDGKFGPSPEVANDLKSNTTNSLGQVSLQANGETTNATFYFQVTRIEDYNIDAGSQTSIILNRPS